MSDIEGLRADLDEARRCIAELTNKQKTMEAKNDAREAAIQEVQNMHDIMFYALVGKPPQRMDQNLLREIDAHRNKSRSPLDVKPDSTLHTDATE